MHYVSHPQAANAIFVRSKLSYEIVISSCSQIQCGKSNMKIKIKNGGWDLRTTADFQRINHSSNKSKIKNLQKT